MEEGLIIRSIKKKPSRLSSIRIILYKLENSIKKIEEMDDKGGLGYL